MNGPHESKERTVTNRQNDVSNGPREEKVARFDAALLAFLAGEEVGE